MKPSFNFIWVDHSTSNLSAVNPIKATHNPIIKPLPPSLNDKALSFSDGGKGLIIGLCVAFIGLTADRLLVEWSTQMKLKLGFNNS